MYSYDPETDPLLKIPPEPQEQSEAQPELVYYQLDHLGTPIAAHNAKGEAVWMAENLNVFDFALSDEDKAEIAKLDGTFAAIVNHDTVDNLKRISAWKTGV